MADPIDYHYGVIYTLAEAKEAASDAEDEGLMGYYPAACVVLAREIARLEALVAAAINGVRVDGEGQQ